MRIAVSRFALYLLLLTAFCAVLEALWNIYMPESLTMRNGYLLLGIFALLTAAVHLFMLYSTAQNPKSFVRFFMVGTALKMMAFVLLLIIYLMFSEESRKALAIHFLWYYAAYTLLEVSMLYQALNSKRQTFQKH